MCTRSVIRKVTVKILKLICFPISAVLGLFCNFGGCMYGPALEYGMPSADYKISGTVKSSDELLPVKGLMVSISDTLEMSEILDSAKTDSSGRYTLQFSDVPLNHAWKLTVKDIDLKENGSFLTRDTIIAIQSSELKEPDGNWNYGHAEKNIDVNIDRQN